MTAGSTYAARSRRRRLLRLLVIAITVLCAIPVGLFMLVASSGERR
ncbi:hypothetical protein NF701_05085 [Sphingomonadaceae bacterium OTU29THOMA1]|nr:hypothetical protein NF701_05085 [Sphingomonadaceae bacterium OTU29THOMA1]